MKSYRKELWFETPGRHAFLNITPQVEAALKESGVQEGLALVNAMHITASVFINDDESGLHADYDRWLEKLAPHEPVSGYRHNRTGEDNADEIRKGGNDGPRFLSNHAGGILGGISTGQPVICRFAVKPTSSILTPRRSVNTAGKGSTRRCSPPVFKRPKRAACNISRSMPVP